MKFPYVPLDSILAEVEAQFKKLNAQGTYNPDDAYSYAVQCAREIGINNYDDTTTDICIVNHTGRLPIDFYLVGEIWNKRIGNPVPQGNNFTTVAGSAPCEPFTALIGPGDSATVRHCHDKRTPFLSANTPTYTIKMPPGIVRTSYREGELGLKYFHLPKDERGWVCIQDEINTIKAVKAGVLMEVMKEDYYGGRLQQYIFNDIRNEYYLYVDEAKALAKFPEASGSHFFGNAVHNRYNNIKL